VHAAWVEVDELTGRADVIDYLAVTEAGRIIDREAFDQQVHGGVAQGLGYALFEDYEVKDGASACPGLAAYVLPTAPDLPDLASKTIQVHEASGPFGLKGVGELPVDPVLPAVANALADAVGARLNQPPFTPEKILAALSGGSGRGG
jgi:CO/xanthine dehydrogenase Mo-binding subunit